MVLAPCKGEIRLGSPRTILSYLMGQGEFTHNYTPAEVGV